ncbi:MAG: cation:proton antiporter [Alphaproteobacteria bacterium]|jgi:Kef-type K+ transport system membrane component KefB/nucleotide-binding universal stress UspA family protein|nr:cation:proton antiporter [Alphaproteobacteria bacterium]MBU0805066.1 cation:proton antiporter [Alphaproteobacteria bacterium]MBU0870565.1 cation:proton antiporter [Alphaproteobacteria bacterium]MBU1401760.1 cation:proton antiporter [Alphaproteobacteria bacterium]MBU1591823.1 cation:proton antiporter [Alphaproteobacteria bacterium]
MTKILSLRRLPLILLAGAGLLALMQPWAAGAVETGKSGPTESMFVLQIILLIVVGRVFGEIFQRIGQPAVMGQLVAGILLGPTLFGWVWPEAHELVFPVDGMGMIDAVAKLGVLMLLLLTGMETDLKLVRKVGAACFSISISGVLVPFACGYTLAQFLPADLLPETSQRVVAGLFLGTALSISSVKIVAMVIREMNFMRRNLGQIIVSSAIIEDTIGWVIIAVTFGIATNGKLELVPLATTVASVLAFMLFSFTIGRRIVFTLIRWTNDFAESEYAVISMILAIMGAMALITDWIGVHTVLGAFVAGILVGESPILTDHIEGELRGVITALFAPVFFGMAGLSADLTVLLDPGLALLTLGLILFASIGKFGGAFVGGKLAGMSWMESVAIGCGMNARGSTEVIVASIGLAMGILSHDLFTMIVTMAVVTTLAMPPMLRWALRRLPAAEDEKQRIDREALDERGFVAKLERLLLAVDDSAVGKFTAYLAGLLGGASGMPTTLLRLKAGAADEKSDEVPEAHLDEIKKGAKESAAAIEEGDATAVAKVHLTARTEIQATGKTIADEARKGYSMLLVGIRNAVTSKGGFSKRLNDLTSGFEGPACIVAKGAAGGKTPKLEAGSIILVPVNGTEVSRRAIDLALALARPTGAGVRALYVSNESRGQRNSVSLRREEAVLKDIVTMADRYGVGIETAIRKRGSPHDAICREAAKGVAMIVMGVTPRSGDELFFGETAAAVVERCSGPIVMVAAVRTRLEEPDDD